MKWEPIKLLNETVTGKDALGNDVTELVEVTVTKARFTPAVDIPIQIDGREVTSDAQFFTIPARADTLPEFTHLEYKGNVYKREIVAAMSPRWTVIRATIYETRTTRA